MTAVDFAYAEWFRMLNEKTNADVYAAGNSAFGPACYEHGAGGDTWFSIKVGGVSADDMLRDALRGDYANVVDRHDHVDTNPTCPKFTEVAVSPPVEGARLHGKGGLSAGERAQQLTMSSTHWSSRRGRLVRRRAVQPPRCPGGHHVVLGLRGRVFRRG